MLFCATFFICLLIFMMQFLWRYVDELVGKGLGITILSQFFFYSALTLIPLSLPLAILLAALMTFGNLGESFELLSMKAAGIPLFRIIRPIIVCCSILCGVSFYFQNVVVPEAQVKLWTLLVSVKQTSPELDIPEGVFYDEIDGYNIFVRKKDKDTGQLQDVLIYNFSEGFENARVIWAEEGKMETAADKQHLFLHLYNGEQFENLKSQTISANNVPYRRETFKEKHALIAFNSDFNMIDGSFLNDRSDSKNMVEISHSIDSLTTRADSVGRALFKDVQAIVNAPFSAYDSTKLAETTLTQIDADSLFESYTLEEKAKVIRAAAERTQSLTNEYSMRNFTLSETDVNIRRHQIDWHKKITLSLACLIFFFIGAPLGAIIRKGGLGMPVIISVLFFVFYYIIDQGATRVAKSGEMSVTLGVWLSTMILAPLGAFFTYKSNNDSTIFNAEMYLNLIKSIFGWRATRHLTKKEVIIEDVDYPSARASLDRITEQCQEYLSMHDLNKLPNYLEVFFYPMPEDGISSIIDQLEDVIEVWSNSKEDAEFTLLNNYPYTSPTAHLAPFDNRILNVAAGILFPVGIILLLRTWQMRKRLGEDLKKIIFVNSVLAG